MIVIDCSVAAALSLPDERSAYALKVLDYVYDKAGIVSVPSWFFIELTNMLLMSKRRKRITAQRFKAELQRWHQSPIEIDNSVDMEAAIALAERYALTFYDAIYLELALRRGEKLATLDKALVKAAKKEGVWFA